MIPLQLFCAAFAPAGTSSTFPQGLCDTAVLFLPFYSPPPISHTSFHSPPLSLPWFCPQTTDLKMYLFGSCILTQDFTGHHCKGLLHNQPSRPCRPWTCSRKSPLFSPSAQAKKSSVSTLVSRMSSDAGARSLVLWTPGVGRQEL